MEYIGLLIIFLFYFGSFNLVKKVLRVNDWLIPIIVNISIMTILFIAGLMNILKQAAFILLLIGAIYAIPNLFKQVPLFISQIRILIANIIIRVRTIMHERIICVVPAAFFSIILSIAFSPLLPGTSKYGKMFFIVTGLCMSLFLFPILLLLVDQFRAITNDRRILFFSIGLLVISSLMIKDVINNDRILPPRTDIITIQNIGNSTNRQSSSEIEFIEVKDRRSLTALPAMNSANWAEVTINEETQALRSSISGQELKFSNQVKGPNSYDLLFNKTSNSGIVRITINDQEYEFNLNSSENNQTLISLRSFPSFHYLVLLTSVVISTLIIPQLLLILILISTNLLPQVIKTNISAFILLSISFIILYKIITPLRFFSWDEFSHWGIFLKEIYIKNKLPVEDFCTVAPFYIPGITLFEYFFLNILGYKEGLAYFAHALFILSEVIVVFVGIKQAKLHHVLTYLPSVLIYMLFFPLLFFTLYVDATLGLLFGVGLIVSREINNEKTKLTLLFLIFCGLQLIKTWGMVLSLIVFAINFFDILSSYRWKLKNKVLQRRIFRLILCILLALFIIQIPWMLHSNVIRENSINSPIHNTNDWEISMNSDAQIDIFFLLKDVFKVFIQGRENSGMNGSSSILLFSIVFYLVGLLISKKDKKEVRWHSMIAGFILVDIFLLYFAYLFWFAAIEAERLASFERYTSEYLIGWLLFLVFEIGYFNNWRKRGHLLPVVNLIGIILTIICLINIEYIHFPSPSYIDKRVFVNSIVEKYEDILINNSTIKKIFHIHQNSDGYEHHILRYELCPNLVQYWGWSYGQPYSDQDLFTISRSAEDLERSIVLDFDYVLITNSDENFWEEYGKIFPNHKREGSQLFEVKDGNIEFLY